VSRVVTHVTGVFLPLSEAWLYDVVTAPVSYEARLATRWRENEEQFPFERVALIADRSRRGSPLWLHHQLHARLGLLSTPGNLWRDSLQALARGSTLCHAHFGWVGWRAVEAGLSPVVTSFYGVDASETATLEQWRGAYRRLFRSGAAFVAEGRAMRERLIALGAPPERTRVIPLVAPLEDEWDAASARGEEPARVLMAGRFVEKKGFSDGIVAFAESRRAGLEARLVILGSGPEEERLRAVARSERVEDDVEFVPPQPRDRFREIVRSCQILLQPSRTAPDGDAEGGAPTTLLEGQALGRVIVASNHADIPNVVDPQAAFLVPEGDVGALAAGLRQALAAPEDWPARGAAGRRFVESNHSRAHVAGLLEGLYDEVALSGTKP
jgi:colanic acid/amylovoran/stewartan biosynthesis glycosyltransferase WcaL/AmsK/CpsK